MIPVLYLHGFASGPSSQKASFFRAALERIGVSVAVPDLADGDFEHLTVTRQLKVIENAAGTSRVSLIGSSMGGWLAGLFAARTASVDRIVLLAPAFGFNRRWPERLGLAEMERWRQEGRLDVYHFAETRTCQLSFDLMRDAAKYEDFRNFASPRSYITESEMRWRPSSTPKNLPPPIRMFACNCSIRGMTYSTCLNRSHPELSSF